MSDTDSFIDEVNEEVRRDRLFGYLRKYGWIGVLAVLILVGGAAYSEWRKAQTEARAQAFGDAVLEALEQSLDDGDTSHWEQVPAELPEQQLILAMLRANQIAEDNPVAATAALDGIAQTQDMPDIYNQIAAFKKLLLEPDTDIRRTGFETLAIAGNPLRVLAEEQLALIDIETGETPQALERLQSIVVDAETSVGLQQRARQAIVALGGTLSAGSDESSEQ